jgi:allantoicase
VRPFYPAPFSSTKLYSTSPDLISSRLGGHVLCVSDEWFAPGTNLLSPLSPIYEPNKQVYTGQWMDGWETRRHNRQAFDYAIIRLGVASGTISGIEIDTAFFKGNEAPAVSVEACFSSDDDEVVGWKAGRGEWEVVLGKQPCGPSQRHGWKLLQDTKPYTHVRLNMYPDGGIARFRLYGTAVPVLPSNPDTVFDLAAAQNGGVVMACSNEEFDTVASNLLLPGRGPDMADGWETARSRTEEHVDWAIVKLGVPGRVRSLVLDTAHFRGNFPDYAQVAALNYPATDEGQEPPSVEDGGWVDITAKSECDPDKEHAFESLVQDRVFTHVKLSIFPDGGVKRLRVFGVRAV